MICDAFFILFFLRVGSPFSATYTPQIIKSAPPIAINVMCSFSTIADAISVMRGVR